MTSSSSLNSRRASEMHFTFLDPCLPYDLKMEWQRQWTLWHFYY